MDLLAMVGKAFKFINYILDNLPNTAVYKHSLIAEKKSHESEGHFNIDLVTGKTISLSEKNF
jgi:hypothetical protein